jgi:hypothetical protein
MFVHAITLHGSFQFFELHMFYVSCLFYHYSPSFLRSARNSSTAVSGVTQEQTNRTTDAPSPASYQTWNMAC